MKKYVTPEMIVIEFYVKDIITVSNVSVDIDGGNTQFPDSWKGNGIW